MSFSKVNHKHDAKTANDKSVTLSIAQTLSSSTAVWQELNGMLRGTTDGTRIARQILMTRLSLGFTIYPTSASTVDNSKGDIISIAIVYDRFVGNSSPDYRECFGAERPLALGPTYPERYEILWHKLYAVQPNRLTTGALTIAAGDTCVVDTIMLDLNHLTYYGPGNTGLNDDMRFGCLYFVACAFEQSSVSEWRTAAQSIVFYKDF